MKVGLFAFVTDTTLRPGDLAAEVEDRGFDSLWVPDHTHIPSSRRTPWTGGAALPPEYARVLDPFCVLTEAAATTAELLLCLGVCLVAQRDPIVLAKQGATVDLLSGGRFVLGVGFGWNVEEMEDHGVDFRRRYSVTAEKLRAVRALWTEEEAAFEGEHVRFEPSWSWPKPVQRPHPPIHIGGKGSLALRQVAELGDGWLPMGGLSERRRAALEEELERRGRRVADVETTVFGPRPDPDELLRCRDAGVDRAVLALPTTTPDDTSRALDECAALAAKVA